MSRKTRTEVVEEPEPVVEAELDEIDHHGFWDRATLDADDNDDAFAAVMDAEREVEDDDDTVSPMGSVTQVDAEEREALAAWAESKACRLCRRKIREHHDPTQLRHDECRTALRVARLLHRYN